jgi:hypothetical protein
VHEEYNYKSIATAVLSYPIRWKENLQKMCQLGRSKVDRLLERNAGGTHNDCGNTMQEAQDGGFIITAEQISIVRKRKMSG